MTAPTDSLRVVIFGRVVIKKNESVVKEVEALQKKVSDEKAAWPSVAKDLAQIKSSVSVSVA